MLRFMKRHHDPACAPLSIEKIVASVRRVEERIERTLPTETDLRDIAHAVLEAARTAARRWAAAIRLRPGPETPTSACGAQTSRRAAQLLLSEGGVTSRPSIEIGRRPAVFAILALIWYYIQVTCPQGLGGTTCLPQKHWPGEVLIVSPTGASHGDSTDRHSSS